MDLKKIEQLEEVSELQAQNHTQLDDVIKLEGNLEKIGERLNEIYTENQTLKTQLAEANKRINEYQTTLENIEPIETALPLPRFENVANESLKASCDKLTQENAQLVRKNNESANKIVELEKQNNVLLEANNELKESVESLQEQNAQLDRKNNEDIAKISKLENRKKELEKLYSESNLLILEQKNDDLEANNSSLYSQLEDLQGKYDEAIETNNDYLIRIRAFEDRHSKDCIKINQLNVTIDTLVDKHSKLRELHGLV
jgi:DNA repair exonuclease SbcCD ATPase subunit